MCSVLVFYTTNKSGDWNKFVNFVTNPIPEDLLKSPLLNAAGGFVEIRFPTVHGCLMDLCLGLVKLQGLTDPVVTVVVLTEMPGI